MKQWIGPAFLLFTVSIAMGVVLARLNHWGFRWLADAKVLATFGAWLVYAVLAYLRRHADRHGRGLAWVAVLGFVCVLFAFVGVPRMAASMHNFGFPVP